MTNEPGTRRGCDRCGYTTDLDPSVPFVCPRCATVVTPSNTASEATDAEIPPEVVRAAEHHRNLLGKYILIEKIGQGGMGVVSKAWDNSLRRYCAVKTLLPDLEADTAWQEQRDRFLREAQTAARLSHPNIVQVYEIGAVNNTNFIAMEYVVGDNLKRFLRIDPSQIIPSDETLRNRLWIIHDVIRAIAHAHAQGIVHRDIKPENIFLTTVGGRLIPKIGDFGLAREIGGGRRVTISGTTLGTPCYMSPEQAEGSREIDARSDVFSLGTLLYEIACGRVPFDGTSPMAVMRAVINQDPLKPAQLNPAIDNDLQTIILKAMEKEPRQRYRSADDLADDLKRWLTGEPILARRATILYRITKKIRKNKAASIAWAFTMSILLAVSVITAIVSEQKGNRAEEYREMADEHFAAGRWQEAHDDYIKALELAGNDSEALARKMQCELEIEKAKREMAEGMERAERSKLLQDEAIRTAMRGWLVISEVKAEFYKNEADFARIWRRIDGAMKELDDSIARYPTALAHFYRGRVFLMRQHHDQAEEEFAKALELDKSMAEAAIFRGMVSMGRYAEAFLDVEHADDDVRRESAHFLDAALDDFQQIGQARIGEEFRLHKDLAIALGALAKQDTEGALAKLEGGYQTHRHEDFLYWSSVIRLSREERTEAEQLARRALERRPQYPEVHHILGVLEKDPNNKIALFSRAIEIAPDFLAAYMSRGDVKRSQGEIFGAIADFEAAVAVNPRYVPGYLHIAQTRISIGDHKGATDACARVIAMNPKRHQLSEAYLHRGNIKKRDKDLEGALADYTKAIELKPHPVHLADAYKAIAALQWETGRKEESVASIAKAIELHPTSQAYSIRSRYRQDLGDLTGAADDLKSMIALEPKRAALHHTLGVFYFDTNQHDLAIEAYTKAIELDPKKSLYYYNRGVAFAYKRKYPEDLNDFTKAIELDPKNVLAWWYRGRVRGVTGDPEGGIEDITRAMEINPWEQTSFYNLAAAYFDRGSIYLKTGKHAEAEADLTSAIHLQARADFYAQRGTARYRQGNNPGAADDWRRAISLKPELSSRYEPWIMEALKRQPQH